jgi:hypothetical protein
LHPAFCRLRLTEPGSLALATLKASG